MYYKKYKMNKDAGRKKWILVLLGHLIVLPMLASPISPRNHQVLERADSDVNSNTSDQ